MERSWLETVQLLGLDMMAALALLALVASAAVRLLVGFVRLLGGLVRRQPRTQPDSSGDAFAPQEWRPS